MTKKREDTLSRREAVIKSARELFLKNGYRLTSVDQIARNAGYSKRTVYLEYPNKDDLFLSIATDGLELLLHLLEEIKNTIPLENYIKKYLGAITDFAFERADYFKLLASDVTAEVIAKSSDETKIRAAGIERSGVKLLADRIAAAVSEKSISRVDPWETAEMIIGSATGIILLSLGGSQTILSPEKVKSKVQKMGKLCYRGLIAGKN